MLSEIMNGRIESNTDFFNNDFNSSIARNLETNTDRLQSASFLFGANNSNEPIPPSFSTPPVPLSSFPITEHKQHIFPSASLPILPTPHPYQHYPHNGEYTTQVSTPGDSSNLHSENCDPIEQEYLLAAKREQEAPALPDTTTDLINLEFSYKKEDLVEKVAGIKIEGHTSSSNTPNSSTSSGVKTPNLLPVSVPRLTPDTLPTSRYVELSHSHETVRNAPAYNAQRADLSGGRGDRSPPPVNGLLSQPPLQEQDPPLSRPALPSTQHARAQSDHSSGSTQLRALLSQQRFPAPNDRFPGSSNSAFSRHPSSSPFPPLPLPPTSQPPLPPPLPPSLPPSLTPPDSQDLEVEQASLNRLTSRSEMVVGASDPEEGTPRSNSALETRFTPAPPPSKPVKKSKRTSKHRVPHVREPSYDTGSDQERQSSGGGGLPRTSSFSALSRTGSRSRNGKPFSVLPQPPHITTEVSLPGHTDPSKRLSPPPPPDPNSQRELPCLPDQVPPRYLPQPPRPYPDPNLSIPVGAEYPYPPYGYPHMGGWPAPGLAPSEEEGPPGYPQQQQPQQQQQQQQHYFPTYYPYPYMMYPPYPSGGEGREEQYPPYPYPYYPMMPPMYHYLSHPGSRAGSYAPSMVDEELTERGSIYSVGAEEGGNPGQEQWQQQLLMERDPSYLLEQVPSQPVSFELINCIPVPDKRCTPLLFDFPHQKGTFSGGGDLILTPHPHSASGVRICTLDQLCRQPWLEGHAGFPGPLNSLSVKSEVVRFAQERVTAAQRAGDTDGALLWEYLSRLCAQNGVLVPSDVVELLSRGGAFSVRGGEDGPGPGGGQAEEQLRLLVLQRRIKEAVELCIAQRLWTHALLLAQGLDEHTRASVQDRFTYSLHASDPLQSYYSAVVGKRPHGVHAAYLREGHSWKQHLAMLVSHRHLPASETSISTLAGNLAECGHTDAAHLVRLIQGQPLGGWADAEAKYSLLGQEGTGAELSSRCLEPKALHKTEVYEYARSLSNSEFCLPGFQPFKLQLARLYAEAGLSARAFSYCEAMFASVEKQPCSYSLAFLSQLHSLADRLHGSLVQLASTPVHQPPVYPRWINLLSSFVEQQRGGAIYVPTPFLPLATPTPSLRSPYPHDTNTPQERALPHPTAQLPPTGRVPAPVAGTDAYQAAMSPDDDDATTESYKSAADESILGLDGHNTDEEIQDFDIPSIGSSPLPPGMISGPQSPSESINRSAGSSGREEAGGFIGIMGNIVGRIRNKSSTNRNQMRLPKSDRFHFDADKNKWIDKEGGEEEIAALVAPPKDTDLRLPVDPSLPLPPIQPQQLETQGILGHNPRSRYVDILNRASLPPPAPTAPLFPTSFDAPFSGTLFFPQLDRAGQGPASDQLGAGGGGRVSPDAVSATTASISEASKEVRQIMRNTQLISKPHPAGMRY